RELAAPGGVTAPLPLSRLADLRRIAPRTLREHLARLEGLGLVTRVYAGNAGLSLRVVPAPQESDAEPAPAGEHMPGAEAGPPAPLVSDNVRKSVVLLAHAGVYPQLARILAHKPWVTPGLIAAWVHELRDIRAVRVLAGVLVHTLQDPERCLPPPDPPPAVRLLHEHARDAYPGARPRDGVCDIDASGRIGLPEDEACAPETNAGPVACARLTGIAQTTPERVLLSRPGDSPSTLPRDRAPQNTGEHTALWSAVHRAMASRLPVEVDTLWLRRAHALSLSDGVLIVAVPSTIGAEWLNLAGAPRTREAIQQAAGRSLIVRFIPAGLREPASD
ncbi:MAG: hypothetical protein R6X16_07375, partial [Anaerolineae bacterium]